MVANSPVIFKFKYYAPTTENQARNASHVDYIANRPGVALGEPNLEEEEYSLESADIHLKYMDERPRSHGLFGQDETVEPNPEIIQKELKEHEGFVWRAIVSIREDDAIRLGYVEREAWEKMLRTSVEEAAGKMGIRPTNLKWVAAFHQAKGHPHAHVLFWEKTPERKRWTREQSREELRAMKKVFVREIYADERMRLGQERTALREYIRSQAKSSILQVKRLRVKLKDLRVEIHALDGKTPGVPPVLNTSVNIPGELKGMKGDVLRELAERTGYLAEIMPKRGRVALKYMPENVKSEAREIASFILRQPEFLGQVDRIKEIAAEYTAHYSTQKEHVNLAAEKAYKDIRDRVAQIVLRGAAEIKKEQRGEELAKNRIIRGIRGIWNSSWRAVEREYSRAQAEMQVAQQKEALREKARQKAKEQGYTEAEQEE